MFIVIEGIDGAGCETQAINLQNWLKRDNIPFSFIKYPNYNANVGKFIREFLYNNKNLDAEMQFLLYSMQFLSDREFIKKERKNKILIADRYFSTTLCFQTLAGLPIEKQLRFADDFGMESTNSTNLTFFCGATCSATNAITSSSLIFDPSFLTTNAFGNSPASKSSIPTTAASTISSFFNRTASNSAGGT